jgi:hypothetical protein
LEARDGGFAAADYAFVVCFEEDSHAVDYGVGVFEEWGVGGGFEDVGAFPGYFVGPWWGGWGVGYKGPDGLAGAAGRVSWVCVGVELLYAFRENDFDAYLIDVTSQPLETAALHILDPKKPLPPQTTIFLTAAMSLLCSPGCQLR